MSLNILIPLAGKNQFFSEQEYPFPKPLIEFCGKTMIEHVIDNLNKIEQEKEYIFVLNEIDCKKFYLDNVLNLLTEDKCTIVKLKNETKGSACSSMMAINAINNDDSLIIANADQLFNVDLPQIVSEFELSDAGVITFNSIHPRWSYVQVVSQSNHVVEAAEKRPISRHAIAGFYYFKHGKDFISAASQMIKKDVNLDDKYYISPCLNEMILMNKKVVMHEIEVTQYHTFYSPQKIKDYERLMTAKFNTVNINESN